MYCTQYSVYRVPRPFTHSTRGEGNRPLPDETWVPFPTLWKPENIYQCYKIKKFENEANSDATKIPFLGETFSNLCHS